MVQRSVAGGVNAILLLSGSTTASSFTGSGVPHSPGPVIGGSDGAMAISLVSRIRQADGSAGSAFGADAGSVMAGRSGGVAAVGASAGRGRGSGTVCAAATLYAATETMMTQ